MKSRPHAVPAVIAGVLLLLAIGAHPYGYFTLLRWVVAVAGVVVAVTAWRTAAQWSHGCS